MKLKGKILKILLVVVVIIVGASLLLAVLVRSQLVAWPIFDIFQTSNLTENPYLPEAKKILTQLDSVKSAAGFYGDYQDCQAVTGSGQGQCQLHLFPGEKLTDDPGFEVSWRENLSVIWARYQYYLATGDKKMLAAIEADLTNLGAMGIEDENNIGTVLQSAGYKCLFLEPIAKEEKFPTEIKDLAVKLCLDTFYEYAPGNTLAYDQHQHRLVFKTAENELGQPTVGVFYETPAPEQVMIYDQEQVVAQIISNLKQIATGGNLLSYSPHVTNNNPETLTLQVQYFESEAKAMVDRIGAMRLAKQLGDSEVFEREELDYLLLLDELMSWRENPANQNSPDNLCLFNLGLAYFVEHYLDLGTDLSAEEAEQASLFYGFGAANGFNCNAGSIMVYGRALIGRTNLHDFVSSLGESKLGFGLVEGGNFWVERNALYAGMLAQIELEVEP
jgi:hypothetical protein